MGANVTSGDYTQILGDFALLSEYDQVITLSTTSKQPSLDLIGIKDESLDFVELKKKGAPITNQENKIKKLVEEKKVSYKVFDIDLPDNFTIEERKLKEKKLKETKPKEKKPKEFKTNKELRKSEAKKEHSMAYEPWVQDDDEFLKKFWNDDADNLSKPEKIQALSQKFDRSKGGILSRLQKLRLITRLEKMELNKK